MGIIRHQRHRIIDTAIVAISTSLFFTIFGYFAKYYTELYQLYERGVIPEPSLKSLHSLVNESIFKKYRTIYAILSLAFIFHFSSIVCLYFARKSNALFLIFLRIFVYACAATVICYCIVYPFIIVENGIKITEDILIDKIYVKSKVHFSSQNIVYVFMFPLVTLAPMVVSAPPVLSVYRKTMLNSKKHLTSAYNMK